MRCFQNKSYHQFPQGPAALLKESSYDGCRLHHSPSWKTSASLRQRDCPTNALDLTPTILQPAATALTLQRGLHSRQSPLLLLRRSPPFRSTDLAEQFFLLESPAGLLGSVSKTSTSAWSAQCRSQGLLCALESSALCCSPASSGQTQYFAVLHICCP